MRILIIGGTRFIGPHVVRRLAEQGHEIVLFHKTATTSGLPDGVREIQGDRHKLEESADQLTRIKPELVLDMIPITEANAESLVGMFTGIARRTVAISSQDVYRAYGKLIGIESCPVLDMPLTEESPLREKIYPYREGLPKNHVLYDYDKILVERAYLGSAELPGTILRLPMVYGPGDYQHRLFPYLKRMDDNRPAIIIGEGVATWRWSKGYVADMAEAIVLSVNNEKAAGNIYNVNECDSITEALWVETIGKVAGWEGRIETAAPGSLPEHLDPGVDTKQDLVSSSEKIRDDLGYQETMGREEALRRTVAWERKNPPESIEPKLFDYDAEDLFLASCADG